MHLCYYCMIECRSVYGIYLTNPLLTSSDFIESVPFGRIHLKQRWMNQCKWFQTSTKRDALRDGFRREMSESEALFAALDIPNPRCQINRIQACFTGFELNNKRANRTIVMARVANQPEGTQSIACIHLRDCLYNISMIVHIRELCSINFKVHTCRTVTTIQ